MMRHQTTVEALGLLTYYPLALVEGYLVPSYNAAVPCSCNWSRTILVWGAVELQGSAPALPQGQPMQQAPESCHPPFNLEALAVLYSPALTLPSGKTPMHKIEHWGTLPLPNQKICIGQLFNKTLHFCLSSLTRYFKGSVPPASCDSICLYIPEKYSLQSLWMLPPLPAINVFARSCLFLSFSQSPSIVR